MSQVIKNLAGGPVPPQVPTSFVTDNGTAVPLLNILDVNGKTSTENNTNGIITKGGTPATPLSNELDIVLTNRAVGSMSTTGAGSANLITLALGNTPGVYTFDITVSGFAKTGTGSPLGCGFTIVGAVRTDGATATLINGQQVDHFEEGTLAVNPAVTCILTASGNNAIIQVTGKSDGGAGFGIDWTGFLIYNFAS